MWEKIAFLVAGAIFGWLLQQYRVARSEEITLLNEHIKDIEKFLDAAQTYWLKTPAGPDEEAALAAKVRATHFATTLLYPEVGSICADKSDEYRKLSQALYGAATGGDFEAASRKLDPTRAMDIQIAATELVHLIRLRRPYIVSFGRLWNEGLIKY